MQSNYLFRPLMVATFLAAGCATHSPDEVASRNPGSVRSSQSATSSEVYEFPTSTLGYRLPMPFFSLPDQAAAELSARLPLDAIGAVYLEGRPFRATAVYVGSSGGRHLFAIAGHVAAGSHPYAVEFGQVLGRKIKVPVDEVPVFASMPADWALYQSTRPEFLDQTGLDGLNQFTRSRIRPMPVSFEPIHVLLKKHPDARFYVAGRAKYATVTAESGKDGIANLWTQASGSQNAISAWSDPKTVKEAQKNVDEGSSPSGDVFVITETQLVSGPEEAFLKDPDGLTAGSSGGDPFLSSGIYWAPLSMALDFHIIGRMSGSPIMMVTGPNRRDVVMVGSTWTDGKAQDIHEQLRQAHAGDTAVPFGGIQEFKSSPYGLSKAVTVENGQLFMPQGEAAPFSFASALSALPRSAFPPSVLQQLKERP